MADIDGADRLIQKVEVDCSATVDEKLPSYTNLAKEGKLESAIDGLSSLEKLTRTSADAISTGRVLVAIVKICFEAKKYDLLNENIVQYSKKRGQLKQAVTVMVQEACTYVDIIQQKDIQLKLIETLRTVTAGKIYVEVERARLTMKLSKMLEADGKTEESAKILQELQVETFGRMENKEKVEFVLEQMRLCIAIKDFIRATIVSKKVTTKYFEEPDTEALKLKYYELMIELDQHESNYLSIAKHYLAVYRTDSVKNDTQKRHEALSCAVIYLTLAAYGNEQNDLIHRVLADPVIEEIPLYKELLTMFTTQELMRWSNLCTQYEPALRRSRPGIAVFAVGDTAGDRRWADLKQRVVEHNIQVMEKYYTRIRLTRMAELLDLPVEETEQLLASLVVSKTVSAKIDRLDSIVSFEQQKEPSDILNEWSHKVNSLMSLVNQATHLINKEQMVHKIA